MSAVSDAAGSRAGPEAFESEAAHAGILTVCVMLATIMQALDATIANVALPYMQGSLSASLNEVNWVLTSYIVAAAIMTPPTGFLAARFGRKRLFLASVAGFTLTSMLCGMAASLTQMVLFRLLQGAFGAALVPLSQSVLLDAYPKERHGPAMALWGIGVMVGPILGPTLGGYLAENYSWRWIFYINLVVGVLAFLGLSAFLPETRRDRPRFDWFGFAALSIALGAFQMMLDRGEQLDWFGSTEIVVEAVAAGLASYLFLAHTFTAERPFIEPDLFKDRNFSSGLILIFVLGVALFATLALLTPFLQELMDYPVETAGFVLAPRGMGTMAAMFLVGPLINRVDARYLIFAGFGLTALALWEMSGFNTDVSAWTVVHTGLVQGLGLGLIFVPLSTMAFSSLPPERRTQATALFSLLRNIGSSIGISVVIFLLDRNTQIMHASLVDHVTAFNPLFRAPGVAAIWNLMTESGRAALNAEVTRQATAIAYRDDFKLMMLLVLAVSPLAFLLKKPPRARSAARAVLE
jgi:DHA2 family multidrug resistance protein